MKGMGKNGAILAAVLSATTAAHAADPTYEDLKQQLADLQAKVQRIESQASGFNSKDLSATIDAVLRDADRRSQLLANSTGGLTAGYDNGFFIGSADGNYLLKPAINAQFRNVTNYRDGADDDGDDEIDNGFEWRRLRFRFDGNLFSRDLTYSFVWDTARNGGAVSLLDAWAQYQFADQWAVKLGQYKASVFQERNLSGFSQLAVDRSLVDALIAGSLIDRVQGISLIHGGKDKDPLRAELAFHDGGNSRNTNFQDSAADPVTGAESRPDWGASARLEFKAFGDWKAYRDFSAVGNKSDLLVLGVAGHADGAPRSNNYFGTIDAQWETAGGLSLFGGLFLRHRDRRDADESTDYGALLQLGYALNNQWELFARYDVTAFDNDTVSAGDEDTFHEFTAGVNYYLGANGSYKHRAKISVDLTYLPDGSPSNQDGLGILAGDEDQWVLRGQFQLMI